MLIAPNLRAVASGMTNLGNTCCMNTASQALSSSQDLLMSIYNEGHMLNDNCLTYQDNYNMLDKMQQEKDEDEIDNIINNVPQSQLEEKSTTTTETMVKTIKSHANNKKKKK